MMKYKQKLEKTKQTSTEDLRFPVWKQQELNLDSTVNLQETTKLEVVGQRLTEEKHCPKCGVTKSLDKFYRHKLIGYETYCKPCQNKNSRKSYKTNMYVNGKYISKRHPLYKPGTYKSFGDAAFESLDNYKTAKQGQVYILYSPAYPSWVKIGMAVDAEDRLKQFQTGSPYRDYILVKAYDTDDRRKAESEVHELLRKTHGSKNEWFVIAAPVAKEILDGYFDENN